MKRWAVFAVLCGIPLGCAAGSFSERGGREPAVAGCEYFLDSGAGFSQAPLCCVPAGRFIAGMASASGWSVMPQLAVSHEFLFPDDDDLAGGWATELDVTFEHKTFHVGGTRLLLYGRYSAGYRNFDADRGTIHAQHLLLRTLAALGGRLRSGRWYAGVGLGYGIPVREDVGGVVEVRGVCGFAYGLGIVTLGGEVSYTSAVADADDEAGFGNTVNLGGLGGRLFVALPLP